MNKLIALGAILAFTSCGGDYDDDDRASNDYDRDTVGTTTRTGTSTDMYGTSTFNDTIGSSGLRDTANISGSTTMRTSTTDRTTSTSAQTTTPRNNVTSTNRSTTGTTNYSSGTGTKSSSSGSMSNRSTGTGTRSSSSTYSSGTTRNTGTGTSTSTGTTSSANRTGTTTTTTTQNEFMIYGPTDVRWETGVANIPNNIKVGVLVGDDNIVENYTSTSTTTTTNQRSGMDMSGQHDLYTVRLQLPANFTWQPNSFNSEQHLTVISGNFQVAEGNTYSTSNLKSVPDDGFIVIPANTKFYGYTSSGAVIQVSGMGPVSFNFAGMNKSTTRRTGTSVDTELNEDDMNDDEDDIDQPDGSEVEPEY